MMKGTDRQTDRQTDRKTETGKLQDLLREQNRIDKLKTIIPVHLLFGKLRTCRIE
jgi:hypothetical protein